MLALSKGAVLQLSSTPQVVVTGSGVQTPLSARALREDSPFYANPVVTNGPYVLTGFTQNMVKLARSETYYAPAPSGDASTSGRWL